MRLIEKQMNDAISNNQNWQKDNTAVVFNPETNESTVFLFNNKIAVVGDDFVQIFDGGYQSNTTKSRLNAILQVHGIRENVYIKEQVIGSLISSLDKQELHLFIIPMTSLMGSCLPDTYTISLRSVFD